jgi:hypothetical protein
MSSFTQRLALLLAGSVLCGAALVAGVPAQTPAPKSSKTMAVKATKNSTVKHRHHRHGRTKKAIQTKTTLKARSSPANSSKS